MTNSITLKQELNKYFNTGINNDTEKLPDIELTEEQISAYDLARYIEKEFSGVLSLKDKKEKLLESMKNYYSKNPLKKLFVPNDGRIKYCCYIDIVLYNEIPEIRLYESMYTEIPSIRIFNNKNDDEVTSYTFGGDVGDYWLTSSKEDLICINAHIKEIKEIFNKEKYYKRYNTNNTSYFIARELAKDKLELILQDLKFSDNLFKVTFIYDYKKNELAPYLSIKNEYINGIENYYGIMEIANLINQLTPNKDTILKKIPINIKELSPEIQNVINHQIKEEEKLLANKETPLTRKRTKSKRY